MHLLVFVISYEKYPLPHFQHFSVSGVKFEQSLIKVNDPKTKEPMYINTIKAGEGPPLVLLHGFAAGVGFWVGFVA